MNQVWAAALPLDFTEHPVLSSARQNSLAMIDRLHQQLLALDSQAPEVLSVAVSGSLGRLEALSHSDCDLLIVSKHSDDPRQCRDDSSSADEVWSLLEPLGFPPPDHDGIFRKAVSVGALCDPRALGSLDEAKTIFGKRMQLLLDCRPVYRAECFSDLRHSILSWYASGYLEHDPGKQWTYLLNDLSRYLHSYSAWKQFDFGDGDRESWYTLQLKLRSSRLLAFAGLLLLLGQSSNERSDKINWLLQRLSLTPLERIASVFAEYGDRGLARISAAYEQLMTAMDDDQTRRRLIVSAPRDVAELGRPLDPAYIRLHDITDVISAEITRFILDRRADWNPRFFQYFLL